MQVLSDEELRQKYNDLIKTNPAPTRNELRMTLKTSIERLQKLGIKVPPAMTTREAAIKSKKASPWKSNFRLKGSPIDG